MAKMAKEQRENVLDDMSDFTESAGERLDELYTEFLDFQRNNDIRLARGHLARWRAAEEALLKAFEAFGTVVDGIEQENSRRWKRGGHA